MENKLAEPVRLREARGRDVVALCCGAAGPRLGLARGAGAGGACEQCGDGTDFRVVESFGSHLYSTVPTVVCRGAWALGKPPWETRVHTPP